MTTLPSLFTVCPHRRLDRHAVARGAFVPYNVAAEISETEEVTECPGGRPITLEELGGEKVWVCVERDNYRGTAVSNLPGGPGHCFFTSKRKHLTDCGWRILIPLPQLVAGESL